MHSIFCKSPRLVSQTLATVSYERVFTLSIPTLLILVSLIGSTCLGDRICAQEDKVAERFPEVIFKESVELRSGGSIEGQVKEIKQDRSTFYIVTQKDGTQIKLSMGVVSKVNRPPSNYDAYLSKLATIEDTVDGHWAMQLWCRENAMLTHRKFHLRRIVQLDPEYKEARSALGYRQYNNEDWVHEDHFMAAQGFVKHKGAWVLPQGVEYVDTKGDRKKLAGEWSSTIRKLRTKYLKKDWQEAERELLEIKDPMAVSSIYKIYLKEKDPAFRKVLIEVLGGIPTVTAQQRLTSIYLTEPTVLNYERAMTMLLQEQYDPYVTLRDVHGYMNPGVDTPNEQVLRAGFLIGEIGKKDSIRYLIDGLITIHKRDNPLAQQGNIQAGTGQNGTSFSPNNGQPKKVEVPEPNKSVLRSLERMTNQAFGFSEDRWREWYVNQHRLEDIDLRRDE